VVRGPTRLLPRLLVCRPSTSSKIIPRISRDDINWPHPARERPCGLAHSSPNPTAAKLQAADGFCQDPLRVYVHPAASLQVVALRSQRVLTGSGSPVSSYGGLGGGHPHFHPHTDCRQRGHEHLIRRSGRIVQDRGGSPGESFYPQTGDLRITSLSHACLNVRNSQPCLPPSRSLVSRRRNLRAA
jgi:hypothetical protein